MTQKQLADKLECKRSVIGSYEEGRAQPPFDMLIKMSDWFNAPIDDMIRKKITSIFPKNLPKKQTMEEKTAMKKVILLRGSINGSLDGLELDNTDDVVEKSSVIEMLNDFKLQVSGIETALRDLKK